MKYLLTILIIALTLSCKQEVSNSHSTRLTVELEKMEISPRESLFPSEKKLEEWGSRILKYRVHLQKEIKTRGLSHNLNKLTFDLFKYMDNAAKCDHENQIIYLGINFTEAQFIHEIGHCLKSLNYAHYFSYEENNSHYIMSYTFDNTLLEKNRKQVLDLFFNTNLHHKLDSKEGMLSHKRMILEKDFNLRTKNLSPKSLSNLYSKKLNLQ